jgi:hypothetical protein
MEVKCGGGDLGSDIDGGVWLLAYKHKVEILKEK